MPTDPLLFATVALVAIATPGPTVLLALNNGARWGVRAALPGLPAGYIKINYNGTPLVIPAYNP